MIIIFKVIHYTKALPVCLSKRLPVTVFSTAIDKQKYNRSIIYNPFMKKYLTDVENPIKIRRVVYKEITDKKTDALCFYPISRLPRLYEILKVTRETSVRVSHSHLTF